MELQAEVKQKKYSKEEREEHIKKWQSSGLGQTDYSRQNNLPPTTFYTWCRKLNSRKKKPSFIEIKFDNKILREENTIELIMGNGISLRMREGISPEIIRGIITGLKGK
jgi:transposase-like protein